MKHKSDYPPILITTAISPPSNALYVKMKGETERLNKSIFAIKKWVDLGFRVVIVDGTGFDFSGYLPEGDIEVLRTNCNQITAQFGKGRSEMISIKYALDHSEVLKKSRAFIKCTGKYFVTNISQIPVSNFRKNISLHVYYNNRAKINHVSTVFFSMSKDFFENNYYLIVDKLNENIDHNDLEHAFVGFLTGLHPNEYSFDVNPILEGWMGTTNQLYPSGNKSRLLLSKVKQLILKKAYGIAQRSVVKKP